MQSKGDAEERTMDFAAESEPASIQSAGSLISSQEHDAELNKSGTLKP